jgi:hypothetical protein
MYSGRPTPQLRYASRSIYQLSDNDPTSVMHQKSQAIVTVDPRVCELAIKTSRDAAVSRYMAG